MDATPNQHETKESTLRELLEQYTRYWYWFVVAVLVALVVAFLYMRYSTALFQSEATVIIKDEKSGGGPAELAAFSDLGGFFSRYSDNKIENELAIFKSKRIISEAVKELNLNIKYEHLGTIKASELYDNKPFTVQFLSFAETIDLNRVPKLYIEVLSDTEYKIENEAKSIQGKYIFGQRVSLPFGDITVLPVLNNPDGKKGFIGDLISVKYTSLESTASLYQRRISVTNDIKNSNVVKISLQSPVRQKAEDFINELIFQYNKDAINDRSQVAQKTSNFIDSRLQIITRELDSVERNKEEFKSSNRLTNIESEAQLILENASEFNKRQLDVATQLELTNTMIDYMEKSTANDLLPANIGLEGDEIAGSVKNYNDLILQRNKLLKNSTSKNPVVENVNNEIQQIRANILSSLQNTGNSLKVSLRDLNFQEARLNSKIAAVPTKEKLYRDIERQQSIKESLYLFLLQQREEASISLAVTAPKAKVVDSAYSSKTPVTPRKTIIYFSAILSGLILPFLFIYIGTLLNTKVLSRRDIKQVLPEISVVGEIPKLKKGHVELIKVNDRSILAESFRILRTNLQYLFLGDLKKQPISKTIFVTSTIKGEGKTFVAFNLALTIALTGKKVVLVGGDIRNPQLHRYLPDQSKSNKGITEYIIEKETRANELAIRSEFNQNLSIVLSGAIPPNPAELLLQERTAQFFEELKQHYDYIIVDTAPSMLVTDTILMNQYADVVLYIARAGFTDKRLLEFVSDAIADGRLSNVAMVLNSVGINNFGYGNKYGYTYSNEKRSMFKRLFR